MALYSGRLLMRGGNESDFDPDKMIPREWAVSTDKKIVRICVEPGMCIRMATYDAFEEDIAKIENILKECQSIQEAVVRINAEVSQNADAVAEYTAQAKKYRDEAKTSADNAKTSEINSKTSETNAKASETNSKASEEHAQAVFESLPEDYGTLSKEFYEVAIKQKASGEDIHVTDSANAKVREFALFGKAKQNGEPTPDNPIEIEVSGASGSVVVKSCGKNLLENIATSETVKGLTFTVNEDKSVTVSGQPSAQSAQLRVMKTVFNFTGMVVLSGSNDMNVHMYAWSLTDNKRAYKDESKTELQLNDQNASRKELFFYVEKGKEYTVNVRQTNTSISVSNVTVYPMIRRCDESGNPIGDDTYEPYKETTATIPVTDFAGIEVSSGGNNVDQNGQEWLSNMIVKYANGSGERVQRFKKYTFTGNEGAVLTDNNTKIAVVFPSDIKLSAKNSSNATVNGLVTDRLIKKQSNTVKNTISFAYWGETYAYFSVDEFATVADLKAYLASGKTTVLYELAEPIRTPLTAEEIAEIEKLSTFYPVTNISNDADCGMSVTYLCDSKNYIDSKIAELATAMVNNI